MIKLDRWKNLYPNGTNDTLDQWYVGLSSWPWLIHDMVNLMPTAYYTTRQDNSWQENCLMWGWTTTPRDMTRQALTQISRYLAQNAAIWLADEVLRYRDHDTSKCQDDISWQLIMQQLKGRNANNGSRIVARNGECTHIYYEHYQY